MEKNSKIFITGHTGLVGSAIKRKLGELGYQNVLTASSNALDLRDGCMVNNFFDHIRPDYVFHAAGKVGGIYANDIYKGEFIYDNLMMGLNVIHASKIYQVKKLLNLGSACIYPKYPNTDPITEDCLLTSELEPTNEPYAISKIATLKMCSSYNSQYDTNFLTLMPSNLYGPGDNYHPENSHVLPAIIRKIYDAKIRQLKEVEMWGTGEVYREFLYSEDLADACVFIMNKFNKEDIHNYINIGSGESIKIKDLVDLIKKIIGYRGNIVWDNSKPNGIPKRTLDITKITKLGWKAHTSLKTGIKLTINDYKRRLENPLC